MGSGVRGVLVAGDGSIWVSNSNDGSIQQVVESGGLWAAKTPISVGTSPYDMVQGLDGSIWVADLDETNLYQVKEVAGAWVVQDPIDMS